MFTGAESGDAFARAPARPIHKREFFRLAVRERLIGRRVLLRPGVQAHRVAEDRHYPGSTVPLLRRCLFDVYTSPPPVVEPLLPGLDILPALLEVAWRSDQSRLSIPTPTSPEWLNAQAKTGSSKASIGRASNQNANSVLSFYCLSRKSPTLSIRTCSRRRRRQPRPLSPRHLRALPRPRPCTTSLTCNMVRVCQC